MMNKIYYSIGEISELIQVKPYIIRYWEAEFNQLKPKNDKVRNRRYQKKDLELLLRIKELVYEKKYTLEGAKNAIRDEQKLSVREKKAEPVKSVQDEKIWIIDELKKIREHLLTR